MSVGVEDLIFENTVEQLQTFLNAFVQKFLPFSEAAADAAIFAASASSDCVSIRGLLTLPLIVNGALCPARYL